MVSGELLAEVHCLPPTPHPPTHTTHPPTHPMHTPWSRSCTHLPLFVDTLAVALELVGAHIGLHVHQRWVRGPAACRCANACRTLHPPLFLVSTAPAAAAAPPDPIFALTATPPTPHPHPPSTHPHHPHIHPPPPPHPPPNRKVLTLAKYQGSGRGLRVAASMTQLAAVSTALSPTCSQLWSDAWELVD